MRILRRRVLANAVVHTALLGPQSVNQLLPAASAAATTTAGDCVDRLRQHLVQYHGLRIVAEGRDSSGSGEGTSSDDADALVAAMGGLRLHSDGTGGSSNNSISSDCNGHDPGFHGSQRLQAVKTAVWSLFLSCAAAAIAISSTSSTSNSGTGSSGDGGIDSAAMSDANQHMQAATLHVNSLREVV